MATAGIRLAAIGVWLIASPVAAQEHEHAAPDEHTTHGAEAPPPAGAGIPPLSDADRAAAFPDVEPHDMGDRAVNSFVLFDQAEGRSGPDGGADWDATAWVGYDRDRLWIRAEGDTEGTRVGEAQAHVLYGRAIARWWDVVVGIRQDVRPGPARTWAAVGLQGLAPYWFEVEATAYVGAAGRTHVRLEAEYELLLTNRLILQPLAELELYGRSDPDRGIGAGLSTLETGLRLRYEIRREVAPYVGWTWEQRFGRTADFARAAGADVRQGRAVAGLRVWF